VNTPPTEHPNRQPEIVEGPSAWARLGAPLALIEFVGACVLTGLVAAHFALAGCSSHGCAILFAVVVLPASVIGGLVLVGLRNLLVREMRTRVMIDVVLAMAVLVWWNIGQRVAENQARLELQQEQSMRAIERAAAGTEDHWGRNRFLEALRRAGSHGPPGQVPAVLHVQDDGIAAEVELLDTLADRYPVGLARVLPDAAAPQGWRGCPMEAADAPRAHGAFLLRPRVPVRFMLPAACASAFRDAPLEFRVGSWKIGSDSPGWWSDSAIAVPGGWPAPPATGAAPAPVGTDAANGGSVMPPEMEPAQAPVRIGTPPSGSEDTR
jgi:hypothetical protein